MTIDAIVSNLKDDTFVGRTRSALAEYPGANPADVDRIMKWAVALRDDVVNLVQEIDDLDEVRMTLAINYIELKSRWIALNTKINYQNFRTGTCDPMTALRGAAISSVLGHVESQLSPEDIDQITSFLAEPVRRAA